MKRKGCELCHAQARMHCESDQANLCWDCDEKVHAANFLVAKHNRTVLCHVCQSPTSWKASGPKLGRTVSICHACVSWSNSNGKALKKNREASSSAADESEAGAVEHVPTAQSSVADHHHDDDAEDRHDEIDNDDYYDGEEDDGESVYSHDSGESVYSDDSDEEDDENQVVPWTSTPPPTTAGSSSDDDEMEETQFDSNDNHNYHHTGCGDRDSSAFKSMRQIAFLYSSSDEITKTATTAEAEDKSAASTGDDEEDLRILRPSKYRRLLSNERPQLRLDKSSHLTKQNCCRIN